MASKYERDNTIALYQSFNYVVLQAPTLVSLDGAYPGHLVVPVIDEQDQVWIPGTDSDPVEKYFLVENSESGGTIYDFYEDGSKCQAKIGLPGDWFLCRYNQAGVTVHAGDKMMYAGDGTLRRWVFGVDAPGMVIATALETIFAPPDETFLGVRIW